MKPGLYVATVEGRDGVRVMYAPSAESDANETLAWRRIETGRHETAWVLAEDVTYARPLVALDSESGEDCRRLADALNEMDGPAPVWMAPQVRTLLRALAAPTPAEPMGLGAVVPLAHGGKAVRVSTFGGDLAWQCVTPHGAPVGRLNAWGDLVVEPGWTP